MELEVGSPAEFASDPVAMESVRALIAEAIGVNEERVTTQLVLEQGRRLAQSDSNVSDSGQVTVRYAINATGVSNTSGVITALSKMKAAPMTDSLTRILDNAGHHHLVEVYHAKVVQINPVEVGIVKPASVAGACVDIPRWTDKARKNSCADYVAQSWCTPEGGYGPGWDAKWGSFADWGGDGVSAAEACCGCGGGHSGAEQEEELLSLISHLSFNDVVIDCVLGACAGLCLALGLAAAYNCATTPRVADEPKEEEADVESSTQRGRKQFAEESPHAAGVPEQFHIGSTGRSSSSSGLSILARGPEPRGYQQL